MQLRHFHILLGAASFFFAGSTSSPQNQISKDASHDNASWSEDITTDKRDGSRKRLQRKGDLHTETLSFNSDASVLLTPTSESKKEERGFIFNSLVEGVGGVSNAGKVSSNLRGSSLGQQAAKVRELIASPLRGPTLQVMKDIVVIGKLYYWLNDLHPPMSVFKWLKLNQMSEEKRKSHRYYKYYQWYFQEWQDDQVKIEMLFA